MKKQIQADELAKDVAGAEALVERHHEHKYEIDAREDAFHALGQAGEELLASENVPKEDITECLMNLAQVCLPLSFRFFTFLFHIFYRLFIFIVCVYCSIIIFLTGEEHTQGALGGAQGALRPVHEAHGVLPRRRAGRGVDGQIRGLLLFILFLPLSATREDTQICS